MEYTLTYSEKVQGWPSFYSFNPDWMIGMNNYFYTFKGGNLYRHNVNPLRNTFYYDWWVAEGDPDAAFTPSSITSVFNDVPLENKLFKTLALQGDDSWQANPIETDIQNSGYIDKDWFEKKEQVYFAFIRNSGDIPAGTDEYALRSLNGVGKSNSVTGPAAATQINFSISPLIAIGTIASVGDYLYYALPPLYSTPILCGKITNIVQNYPAGDNYFVVDTTVTGGSVPPIADAYFLYIKSSVAESHGVLGHYCVFTLENNNTSKIELFAVESEVMKSYP
jgi:hypothetical protein